MIIITPFCNYQSFGKWCDKKHSGVQKSQSNRNCVQIAFAVHLVCVQDTLSNKNHSGATILTPDGVIIITLQGYQVWLNPLLGNICCFSRFLYGKSKPVDWKRRPRQGFTRNDPCATEINTGNCVGNQACKDCRRDHEPEEGWKCVVHTSCRKTMNELM